jgi:hypothetical protein
MPSKTAWRIVLSIAAIKFFLHLYTSGFYHYFRDELYFIACGRHLAWGFVDHPPLVAVYARIGEFLSEGLGLRGFRLLGTIAGALRIVLTGVLAARIGGGRMAQTLACVAALFAGVNLGVDNILSMNTFEHLFWLGCLLVLVEIANGGDERWWLVFGGLAGVGLQNKHSMLFLGFAIAVALVLTPLRRSLARPWIYAGGAVALLIFLPNLIWELQLGFPTLELLRNVKESGKNVVLAPLPFMGQQIMMLNPFSAPLWIGGLLALLFSRDLARYRVLAWTYIVFLITMLVLEAKDYYVAPIYPALFAAGATWFFAATASRVRRVSGSLILVLIVAGGLLALPLTLPLLSPPKYLAYQRALGIKRHKAEVSHNSEMPQIFADQFGWEEMVQRVARYYNSLPPEVRRKTAIYAGNYGEAGAIDLYGPKYGLPPAISGHQNYFLWGTHGFTGESVILIEDEPSADMWQSLRLVDRCFHPYGMPEENVPIYHGIGLKTPLEKVWPRVKHWR